MIFFSDWKNDQLIDDKLEGGGGVKYIVSRHGGKLGEKSFWRSKKELAVEECSPAKRDVHKVKGIRRRTRSVRYLSLPYLSLSVDRGTNIRLTKARSL